jgi:hypothetical protein
MTPYRLESTPGADEALAERAGAMVQATFEVPAKGYAAFASVVAAGEDPAAGSTLVVRESVFPPRRTRKLLAHGNPDTVLPAGSTIVIDGLHAEALIAAALGDGIDFWYTPAAGGFTIYADHDDYATIFAPRQGAVSRLSERLRLAGFHEVPSYRRKL